MDQVCEKIASFPPNAARDLVEASLKPIIDEAISMSKVEGSKTGRKLLGNYVSPLMLACDKGQLGCLQYFYDIFAEKVRLEEELEHLEMVIGRPFDTSPDNDNQAAHYASLSRFPDGIIYIVKILNSFYNNDHKGRKGCGRDYRSLFSDFIEVISQTNSNGDTLLMMASFLGDVQLLETLYNNITSVAREEKISFDSYIHRMRDILTFENKDGNSCLSFAYSHGHYNVVDFLIKERLNWESSSSDGLVLVSYKDVDKAKIVMNKGSSLLSMMNKGNYSDEQEKSLKQNVQNTKRCLVMLQIACAHLAEKRATEFLNVNEKQEKKALKKKTTKLKKKLSNDDKIDQFSGMHQSDDTNQSTNLHSVSVPFVKTLSDGTIVTSVNQEQNVQEPQDLRKRVSSVSKDSSQIMLMQTMLKDRCSQSTTIKHISSTSTSEAILESLCLDASMLLLSSHGMAMELSPCQLDAIEQVLNQQLDAVADARQIHHRLMAHMKRDSEEAVAK